MSQSKIAFTEALGFLCGGQASRQSAQTLSSHKVNRELNIHTKIERQRGLEKKDLVIDF